MKIKYKKTKVPMPHCGDCGELLIGNNTELRPYECSCGKWKSKSWEEPFKFILRKDIKRHFPDCEGWNGKECDCGQNYKPSNLKNER